MRAFENEMLVRKERTDEERRNCVTLNAIKLNELREMRIALHVALTR